MNSESYFTVSSDKQHPAQFVQNFLTPVNLGDNYEIGLRSLCHGSVYNVISGDIVSFLRGEGDDLAVDHIYLDEGFYYHTAHLFKEIFSKLKDFFEKSGDSWGNIPPEYIGENQGKLSIKMPKGVRFVINEEAYPNRSPLANLLHLPEGEYSKISVYDEAIPAKNHIGFLYSSVIAESYINNEKSRLMAVIPLTSNHGYNYFEYKNPTYYPLSVSTFRDIFFILKDVHGEEIKIGLERTPTNVRKKEEYPTILNLHVRKRL